MADLLIVDDDLDSAEALADILRAEGHEVRVGYDGNEGLRLAGERYPDAALLDVEMPHLGGPEWRSGCSSTTWGSKWFL